MKYRVDKNIILKKNAKESLDNILESIIFSLHVRKEPEKNFLVTAKLLVSVIFI